MEAPNLPSFFKSPRSKRFKYLPFYYDKEKEERELRRKQYERAESDKENALTNSDGKSYHTNYSGHWGNANSVNRIKTSSNQRLIFIIVGLLALTWWFYRDLLL